MSIRTFTAAEAAARAAAAMALYKPNYRGGTFNALGEKLSTWDIRCLRLVGMRDSQKWLVRRV